jgi:hypothetical protein
MNQRCEFIIFFNRQLISLILFHNLCENLLPLNAPFVRYKTPEIKKIMILIVDKVFTIIALKKKYWNFTILKLTPPNQVKKKLWRKSEVANHSLIMMFKLEWMALKLQKYWQVIRTKDNLCNLLSAVNKRDSFLRVMNRWSRLHYKTRLRFHYT